MTERIEIESLRKKRILILYSVPISDSGDETWIDEKTVNEAIAAIETLGLNCEARPVNGEIKDAVAGFSPEETIILNWCEGYLDDGNDYWSVPTALDRLGYVYTGNDPKTLVTTGDKQAVKKILVENRIPTPKFTIYNGEIISGWDLFPALTKPVNEHSSVGITRDSVIDNYEQLVIRAKELLEMFDENVLIEDFIDGSEFNVAIWGGKELQILPISVIDYHNFPDYHDRLCVYDAKWHEDSDGWKKTTVVCPAPMGEKLCRDVSEQALKAFLACGCRDYARIDIRIRDDQPYILDVNVNPDITAEGGFMVSAMTAGYSYGEALAKLLVIAAERAQMY